MNNKVDKYKSLILRLETNINKMFKRIEGKPFNKEDDTQLVAYLHKLSHLIEKYNKILDEDR